MGDARNFKRPRLDGIDIDRPQLPSSSRNSPGGDNGQEPAQTRCTSYSSDISSLPAALRRLLEDEDKDSICHAIEFPAVPAPAPAQDEEITRQKAKAAAEVDRILSTKVVEDICGGGG